MRHPPRKSTLLKVSNSSTFHDIKSGHSSKSLMFQFISAQIWCKSHTAWSNKIGALLLRSEFEEGGSFINTFTFMYLNIFCPQTSPLSFIGRDLWHACRLLNNYCHTVAQLSSIIPNYSYSFPYLKVDSLKGCSRLTLTILISSSSVKASESNVKC